MDRRTAAWHRRPSPFVGSRRDSGRTRTRRGDARAIRQRVQQYRFDPRLVPAGTQPTISVGVAVLTADSSAQDLIARADRALYAAKAAGKNCVRLAAE